MSEPIRGLYGYHDAGGRMGFERFTIERGPGRALTLRSYARFSERDVERDVVYATDAEGRFSDAVIRLGLGGAFAGAGWFRALPDGIEGEALTADRGRVSQRIPLPAPPAVFGTHALVNDGWIAALDQQRRQGERVDLGLLPACSSAPDGATGPAIELMAVWIGFMGEEDVAVTAGRFAARRYQIGFADYPPIDIWLAGAESVMVRQAWSFDASWYEAEELSGLG